MRIFSSEALVPPEAGGGAEERGTGAGAVAAAALGRGRRRAAAAATVDEAVDVRDDAAVSEGAAEPRDRRGQRSCVPVHDLIFFIII